MREEEKEKIKTNKKRDGPARERMKRRGNRIRRIKRDQNEEEEEGGRENNNRKKEKYKMRRTRIKRKRKEEEERRITGRRIKRRERE